MKRCHVVAFCTRHGFHFIRTLKLLREYCLRYMYTIYVYTATEQNGKPMSKEHERDKRNERNVYKLVCSKNGDISKKL